MNDFNLDALEQIKRGIEPLEEVVPIGKKGVSNSVEIANESGSDRAVKSAVSLEEGTNQFFACFEEFQQSAEDVHAYYTKLNAAVNM